MGESAQIADPISLASVLLMLATLAEPASVLIKLFSQCLIGRKRYDCVVNIYDAGAKI